MNGWWDGVYAILEEKSLLKHPFYQAWTQGRLTREDLAHYAGQYYRQESQFPRFVSAVHSRCPEPAARRALLENLVHEEGGSDTHAELWLRFAEAVGMSRESAAGAAPHLRTQDCVRRFSRLTGAGHWAEGAAALYAYEAQQPAVATTKMDGLVKFYGISDPGPLEFFAVHAEMDVWHSDAERTILLDQAAKNPGLKEPIVAAVSAACDALNGLLDGVCEARGIGCVAVP